VPTHLLTSRESGVARITLNRPDVLNSFNAAMATELQHELAAIGHDSAVRAVLLTGAGRGFCAGQDLAEALPRDGQTWNPLVLGIRTLEKPVVCAVNGTAAGAGANLAFACDLVFASREANFIQSFAKIGVIPDTGGTFLLPRIVGLQRATALTMLARQLATQPTRALGLIKRGFNRSLGVDLATQLEYEEDLQREAGRTADYAEGVGAFLEKRKPNLTGQ
jgi:2-(1,2-epoxy-1,2-dihydrophenyl)acetyl-CoA isomerase